MIGDFIYKYYIDPIRYGQPYNVVDTLTYAIILILAVFLIYRWLRRAKIGIDHELVVSTLPFVVLGGLLRVVEDTGMIRSDARFLLITPLIYFVLFFYTVFFLVVSRSAEERGLVQRYSTLYAGCGVVSCIVAAAILIAFGLSETRVALDVFVIILGLAAVTSYALWAFLAKVLKWQFVSDILYKCLIFGHMLDASATSFGIDLHPVHYIESHVVGSNLIAFTGTAFSMFPLKLLVIIPAIYVLELYRKEGNQDFWHLILLAMIIVGLAPGVRDLWRMVLYV